MAATSGQQGTRLIDRLLADPEGFEIFEAVRIIEEEAARACDGIDDRPPPRVGSHDARAGRLDPLRFRATLSTAFPGGALTGCRKRPRSDAPEEFVIELDVASFGLVGPSGVLPRHYTTLVFDRVRRFKDAALRDFLDVFGHRAASLLVRAWAKYRLAVQHGLRHGRGSVGVAAGEDDHFRWTLVSLVGLGTSGLGEQRAPGVNVLLHYSGILSRRIPAVLPLQQLIADVWRVGVHIDQFVGRWLQLAPADQTRIGSPSATGGGLGGMAANSRLGIDAVAGSRVWSVEAGFRVRIGPLTWAEYCGWLPGTERLGGLSSLLRYHAGLEYDITVCPVLKASEIRPCAVGGAEGGRLGWTSWLVSTTPQQDASDAEFAVHP
jgi:type VI secretion system protein ImpH